jgi:hypothetical protein
VNLVNTITKIYSQGFHINLFHILEVYMNSGTVKENKKRKITATQCWPGPKAKSACMAYADRRGRACAHTWRRAWGGFTEDAQMGKIDGVSTTKEGGTRQATLQTLGLTDGLR